MAVLSGLDPVAVAQAAALLATGELVGIPTETVYGLGARADDDSAVAKIFAAKGRPAKHPLIVHVADLAAAERFCTAMPPIARRLAQAFWPGPLTLVLERAPGVATAAAGGLATVGLRCPDHPVALALLQAAAELGVAGVAAPSANRFGRVSPTLAAHVRDEFGPGLCVLDGGACAVGIESTIVDCSRGAAVLLRPGQLGRAALEQALGQALQRADALAPRVPGSLASHYAPRARLRLFSAAQLQQLLAGADRADAGVAVYSGLAADGWRWWPMPADPAAVAHELFAVLRAFDAQGVREIWVQQPPAGLAWEAVLDRLSRAATPADGPQALGSTV